MVNIKTRPTVKVRSDSFFIDYALYQCPVRGQMSVALLDVNGDYWTGANWSKSARDAWQGGYVLVAYLKEGEDDRSDTESINLAREYEAAEKLTDLLNSGGITYLETEDPLYKGNLFYREVKSFHHHKPYEPMGVQLHMRVGEHHGADWWNPMTNEYALIRNRWVNHFDAIYGKGAHATSVRAAQLRHKKRLHAIARAARRRSPDRAGRQSDGQQSINQEAGGRHPEAGPHLVDALLTVPGPDWQMEDA